MAAPMNTTPEAVAATCANNGAGELSELEALDPKSREGFWATREDYLRFQVKEIESAKLRSGDNPGAQAGADYNPILAFGIIGMGGAAQCVRMYSSCDGKLRTRFWTSPAISVKRRISSSSEGMSAKG